MAVHVDELFRWPLEHTAPAARALAAKNRGWWCHLTADSDDELYAFASRLGLLPSWAQRSRTGVLHFDITPGRRRKALRLGAIDDTRTTAAGVAAAREPGEPGRTTEHDHLP